MVYFVDFHECTFTFVVNVYYLILAFVSYKEGNVQWSLYWVWWIKGLEGKNETLQPFLQNIACMMQTLQLQLPGDEELLTLM